jgi:hypothetical protein
MTTYTLVHVAFSLVGIASGLVVLLGLLAGRRLSASTAVFLGTTVATSLTGYGFPFDHLLPSHIVGAISLVAVTIAIYSLYARHLAGIWRTFFVVGAVVSLYLNVFVLIVQSFMKVPSLHALAPTQSEPPFAVVQLAVLVLFIILGTLAVRRSRTI